MPDQDVTTVHLKDGTTLHLKGSNLSPEQVTQKVSAFRATQQQDSPQSAAPSKPTTPKGTGPLGVFLDSHQHDEMQKGNVEAAKFGADVLAGKELLRAGTAFFKPAQALSKVPGGRNPTTGRMNPWKTVSVPGKSTAQNAAAGVVKGAKDVLAWSKANPVKAVIITGIAHELGIDPLQLAGKVLKYGKWLVP